MFSKGLSVTKFIFITLATLISFNSAFAKEWAVCFSEPLDLKETYEGQITLKLSKDVQYEEPCIVFKELKDDPKEYLMELQRTQDRQKLGELAVAITVRKLLQDTRFGIKE